jgi:4-amino-4-deoxy-L-arabinose transferase-like glycosyltransferase
MIPTNWSERETDFIITAAVKPKTLHWTAFFLLLALAGYLRHFAFFLPSNIGDSTAYQSLAMKMNHGFMRQYNIFNYRIAPRREGGMIDYVWETNPRNWQSHRLRKIYHQPLHLQPPLFPILIWISHGILQNGEPYTSVSVNKGQAVKLNPPWHLARAQFYAIILPFLASLGTLLLVYLFCLRFLSYREGLLAAAILVTSPVDIAVGPKLYADSLLTFFCMLSLYWYFRSLDLPIRGVRLYAIAAGIALGLAYLSKVSGILFASGFLVATLLHPRFRFGEKWKAPQIWYAAAAAFLVALPWFYLMNRHYGSIMVNSPPDPTNSWYNYVFSRPAKAYLTDLLWFVPPMALGILGGIWAWLKPHRNWALCSLFAVSLFYGFMFWFFSKTGSAGIEDRYLLPIYPPLAILSGWTLSLLAQRIPLGWPRRAAFAAIGIAIAFVGWKSAQYGLQNSFDALVIFHPLGY